ncbi:MAG: replicative DNA helicase [Victivallales bacterium]|nr:replicative DNA helicase [Victivallales bacterium]
MEYPQSKSMDAENPLKILNIGRKMPANEEAEQAVLGAMLFSAEAASTVMGQLRVEGAFARPANQTIFNAMQELVRGRSESAIDPVVLADTLERSGMLEAAGGREYITQLMEAVPTAANVEFYVDIVKQNAILRHLITTCADTMLKCYECQEDARTLLDSIEQRVFEVTGMNETKELMTVQPLVREAVEYLDKLIHNNADVLGLRTGYEMDRMITGLKPGELFVIAARPSIGKTAFALNIATNIALAPTNPVPVGIFSLEMPALQLILRMICSLSRTSLSEFRNNGQINSARWQEVMNAAQAISQSKFIIDDTGAIDILELRAKARRMCSKYGVKVIFIDYLQLIHAQTKSNASRENEVSMISGSLKAMAKELNIPVVVLAQLNRQAEQGEKPKLSHLRESGAIEQDADVVAILHREREKQMEQKEGDNTGLPAEVIIAKNRNGGTGTQELLFFPKYTRFENKARIDDSDVPQ